MTTTLTSILLASKNRPASLTSAMYKENKIWKKVTWPDHFENCAGFGSALLSSGIKKGDSVAILAGTSYKWAVADLGAIGIGALSIPIYQSNTPEEVAYIINDSQVKLLICEDFEQYKKWQYVAKECPSVESVVLMKDGEEDKGSYTLWNDFVAQGVEHRNSHPQQFEEFCQQNEVTDVASIIYTSGTTGNPKGVVVTHQQITSEIADLFPLLNVNEQDCALTFLPFAHVIGRVEMWGSLIAGYTLAFAESIEKIKFNLQEVQPTLLIAVPRIFEKIYNGIISQVETSRVRSEIFRKALSVGKKVSEYKQNKQRVPLHLLAQFALAKKLVFNKIKEKMGGRLRFAFSGGAPLSQKIAEFFHAADLLILEGYGLTETTAAVTVNTPLSYKFGTVGQAFGDVQLKFADDGEILVKSNKVMVEYYNNSEATDQVFTDGYFHTGDIGELDPQGFLRITDRKKDLIKTAGGKYVAPQKLENLLKLNSYISNVLIHGDQRKYIVALVTLDEENIKKYALENKISFGDIGDLSENPQIKNLIQDAVAEVNDELASFETIKNFGLLRNDFTIESGELTPSLKVKRKHCDEKYGDELDKLYGTDKSSI